MKEDTKILLTLVLGILIVGAMQYLMNHSYNIGLRDGENKVINQIQSQMKEKSTGVSEIGDMEFLYVVVLEE